MSTELETTKKDSSNPAVMLTSFFGGADRGRCVQLTQVADGNGWQLGGTPNAIMLTQSQAIDTIITLMDWIDENPVAEGVFASRLIERSFSARPNFAEEDEAGPELSIQEKYPNLIIEED